jgi:cytoskeletal protein RodZ
MSSFGETLKRERELRQITLREIAEATKINLRYLDALERNEFRHLPGGVFNRGFVRAFAQHIGIDPEAMIDSYLEENRKQDARLQEKDRDRARRAAGEPYRVPIAEPPSPPRLGPWIAGAILLLAVAIALGLFVIRFRRTAASHESPVTSQAAAPGTSAPPRERRTTDGPP